MRTCLLHLSLPTLPSFHYYLLPAFTPAALALYVRALPPGSPAVPLPYTHLLPLRLHHYTPATAARRVFCLLRLVHTAACCASCCLRLSHWLRTAATLPSTGRRRWENAAVTTTCHPTYLLPPPAVHGSRYLPACLAPHLPLPHRLHAYARLPAYLPSTPTCRCATYRSGTL